MFITVACVIIANDAGLFKTSYKTYSKYIYIYIQILSKILILNVLPHTDE